VTVSLAVTLLGVGFVGAFCSGLLGIGGALVMFPLLLYAPPLLGVGQLEVKDVIGITIVLVFVAALAGFLAHRRRRAVNEQLVRTGGIAGVVGSFSGALASKRVDDAWLLVIFALMAMAGAILILNPGGEENPAVTAETLRFDPFRVVAVAGGVGLAAGFVGAGGFLLVPLLTTIVGVPIRISIGSALGITTMTATAGLVGKLVTHQVPFLPALAVTLGAIPGARLGAAVSRRVSVRHLKLAFAVTVVLAAARVWWDVIRALSLGRG
jgi:uncharacterized membrane protein YfcA